MKKLKYIQITPRTDRTKCQHINEKHKIIRSSIKLGQYWIKFRIQTNCADCNKLIDTTKTILYQWKQQETYKVKQDAKTNKEVCQNE